ncbi:PREDICTED: probable calcium-binding protein CML44 [Tarenaya hassleriana]|uniref:probable calcium-binding protein CML44 n=1 Tax=Tarenaya hassleriana TaxID=28532 RepID=UPI00053C7AA2|nr:PREDICTED: probable calcium-binding protein CML44 [Tarenaya hassleriana]
MSALATDDLQRIFKNLDKNGDGFVSSEELLFLLQRIGVQQFSLQDIESIFSKPRLDLVEFLIFYDSISKKNGQESDHVDGEDETRDLAEAFRVFDLDGNGVISSDELQSVLSRLGLWEETSGDDCRRMIRVYDTNLDGVLDFDEFKNMMLSA